MEEWKEYKLGDVCSRLRSGKGIKAESVFATGLYPVIGGNGIRGYTNVSNFKGKCAVIGRQGAYCGNVRFYEGEAYMTEHAVVAVGNEFADTRFLACLLSLMHLGNLSAQSAQPGLSVQTLSKQLIRLPSIDYQRRVSSIIKSLDDKIECNQLINDNLPYLLLWMTLVVLWLLKLKNDNLEQQTQAIFKSWFVDFDPFKDGEFVESEKGLIPKGWRWGTLGELIVEIETGSRPKGGAETDGIPSVGAEKIERFGYYDYSGEKYINREYFDKMKRGHVKDGDVLLYKDGAYTGKTSMALDGFPYKECAVNEHVFLLRTESLMYQFFLYCIMAYPDVQTMVHTLASAKAAQPGLNQKELLGVTIIIPNESIEKQFNDLIAPSMHMIAANALESRRLAEIRDTLLPRLMSGELKVNEIETIK